MRSVLVWWRGDVRWAIAYAILSTELAVSIFFIYYASLIAVPVGLVSRWEYWGNIILPVGGAFLLCLLLTIGFSSGAGNIQVLLRYAQPLTAGFTIWAVTDWVLLLTANVFVLMPVSQNELYLPILVRWGSVVLATLLISKTRSSIANRDSAWIARSRSQ